MIRVLQIVTHMNRGGLESMIMNYYRALDRNQVQFDFLFHRDHKSDYDDEIRSMGGKIYNVSRQNPFSPVYYRELNRFFREHHYEVVHCHLDCMSAYPLRAAKRAGVKIRIAHAHSSSQDKDWKYPIKLVSRHLIPRYATHLLACGKAAGDWMFVGAKYKVLNNAIDTKQFKYDQSLRTLVRKQWGMGNVLVVGHVGRFCAVKNHEFLLDLFEEIHKYRSDSILFLVGTGELEDVIRQKLKKKRLAGNVIFAGLRDDVNELMQAMDVFVFPSLYEGLPVSLIEAQASGLPCVVSDRVSKECKITDNVVFLSLEESLEQWRNTIEELYCHDRKDTTAQISRAGYDIGTNLTVLMETYRECVK